MNEITPFAQKSVANPTPTLDLDFEEVCKFIDPKKLGTPQEYKHFFELCKMRGMNPLLKEVYWIKYSSNQAAANVIAVDTFVARAGDHQDYEGYESGWYIQKDPKDPNSVETTVMPYGRIVGAWCSVFRTNMKPFVSRVRIDAYSTGKSRWGTDPAGMIEKCAIAGAHRKAYPKSFAQLYSWEEMDQAREVKDVTPPKKQEAKTPSQQVKEWDEETKAKKKPAKKAKSEPKSEDSNDAFKAEFLDTEDQDERIQLFNQALMNLVDDDRTKESYQNVKSFTEKHWNTLNQNLDKDHRDSLLNVCDAVKKLYPDEA